MKVILTKDLWKYRDQLNEILEEKSSKTTGLTELEFKYEIGEFVHFDDEDETLDIIQLFNFFMDSIEELIKGKL